MADQPSGYQNIPPTRIVSWLQNVRDADPGWQYGLYNPWIYQFSNGRLFLAPNPLYSFPDPE